MAEHKHDWRRWASEDGLHASARFPGPHFHLRWCPDCEITQMRYPGKAWKTLDGIKVPVIQVEMK